MTKYLQFKRKNNIFQKLNGSNNANSSQTKIIISQEIGEPCGVKQINEKAKRRRREWDEHVTRMDAERSVKISMDNITAGSPKRRWSEIIPGQNRWNGL